LMKLLPIKPAPPVTKIFFLVEVMFFSESWENQVIFCPNLGYQFYIKSE
jgi:hypothetical protein